MEEIFLVAGLMVLWGFVGVLQFKQGRRYRADDSPMESAIVRARERAGTRPPGASSHGYERILPHPLARFFFWISGLGCLALAGLIFHWWWKTPGHGFSAAGITFFLCGMIVSTYAINMAMTRASLNYDSFVLETLFTRWKVQRAEIVGCRWVMRIGAMSDAWYVEQTLVDRAGRFYRIPNVLKDRIPQGSWVRMLPSLGDDWRPY